MVAAYEYQVKCGTEFVNNLNALAGSCEAEKKKKCSAAGKDWVNNNCVPKCSGGQIRNADGKCECPAGQTMTVNGKCSSSCGAGSGILGTIKNWWHNIKGETANCGKNCFNPGTKCCLASKAVGEQCDGACYDPKKECCVDGKKISKSCQCYYIGERLDAVNKRIIKYDQHLPLSQTEPGAPTIAWTSCWPWPIGPWTDYAAGFNTFDPVIQDGIRVHESEHRQQCINMGRTRYMELLKEKEYVIEIPAYEKERKFLDEKFTEKCK